MTENWSRSWNSSTSPTKQRKYRENAPKHVKQKLVSSNVSDELRKELRTRSLRLRTGDQIKVMRGDFSGETGIVNNIDYDNQKVYVNGIMVERQNGTEAQVPLRPSNIQVVAMNVDDELRMEKFDVATENLGEIEVDEDEMEEALEEDDENEMMKQMQSGKSSMEVDTEEDEEIEEIDEEETKEAEEKETEASTDYSEFAEGTMDDFKSALDEVDNPDYDAAIEAEKSNKNRKTMIEWLEQRKDN